MESTAHKALIYISTIDSRFKSEQYLSSFQDDNINRVIIVDASEGHHFLGESNSLNCYGTDTFNEFYYLGNFTRKQIIEPDNHYTTHRFHIIPIKHTPFTCFSKGTGNVEFHRELTHNDKSSLVSFVYQGGRPDRNIIVTELYKRNLLQNTIYHCVLKEGDDSKIYYSTKYELEKIGYNDYESYEKLKSMLPIDRTQDTNVNHRETGEFFQKLVQSASRSLFYIISETNTLGKNHNTSRFEKNEYEINVLTEKSATPFLSKCIPIFITYDSFETFEYMKSMGFDCFEDVIPPEIYKLRFVEMVNKILDIVESQNISFYEENKDRFEKNYQLSCKFINEPTPIFQQINDILIENNLKLINI